MTSGHVKGASINYVDKQGGYMMVSQMSMILHLNLCYKLVNEGGGGQKSS